MAKERAQLKQSLGRVEVFALTFGTMIGWGFVSLPVMWIGSGGVLGAILSLLIAMTLCLFVGQIYAELTSAFPLAGAEVAFTYRSMGVLGSWFTGWMVCLAYIGIASFEGIALTMALNYLFPIPEWGYLGTIIGFDIYFSWIIIGLCGAVILTVLNIRGIRQVAVFQILLLLVMIFSGIVYFLGAFAFGEFSHNEPVITNIKGVEVVLIMTPTMFIGFDMVAKSAEEMNMPLRNVSKVLILSIFMAGGWYMIMTLATYLLLPSVTGVSDEISITADLAGVAFQSTVIMKMIIIGGIIGIITTWNGFIVGASRIIFAMSRARMLPAVFSIVHPKYKTPVSAILFVGLFCCISPFLGPDAFSPLLNIVAFGTVISYLMVSISFLLLRKKEPDLRKEYKVKNGRLTGIIALAGGVFFLFWYTPLSPIELNWVYEWVLISVWLIIGTVFFLVFRISEIKNKVSASERETLIFSDELAREISK